VDTRIKPTTDRRWLDRGPSRTIAAVVVTLLLCGATTAVAAKLITGDDIKSGSIPRGDLKKDVQNAIPVRVTGGLRRRDSVRRTTPSRTHPTV
jgi:hypothetical protein